MLNKGVIKQHEVIGTREFELKNIYNELKCENVYDLFHVGQIAGNLVLKMEFIPGLINTVSESLSCHKDIKDDQDIFLRESPDNSETGLIEKQMYINTRKKTT